MPVLRFHSRTRGAGRTGRLCGRSAAGAAPLFAGCPPAAGHPLFRRRHAQPAHPGGCSPADPRQRLPSPVPRSRWKPTRKRSPRHRSAPSGKPASTASPSASSLPGTASWARWPSPHGPAGAGGIRSRAAGRLREHQRRHHAGPAPLYAGGVRRDAGADRKRRCHPHLGLSAKDRAGLCVRPASAGGTAHLDEAADFYLYAVEQLEHHGYRQYEISNFAKPGYEGKHNLIYWDCGDYLGLGPAAHSCMGGRRFCTADTEAFLHDTAAPVLDGGCGAEDYLILQLRLRKGLDLAEYKARSGRNFPRRSLPLSKTASRTAMRPSTAAPSR